MGFGAKNRQVPDGKEQQSFFFFLKKALEEQFSQKKSNLLTHITVRVQSLNLDC